MLAYYLLLKRYGQYVMLMCLTKFYIYITFSGITEPEILFLSAFLRRLCEERNEAAINKMYSSSLRTEHGINKCIKKENQQA